MALSGVTTRVPASGVAGLAALFGNKRRFCGLSVDKESDPKAAPPTSQPSIDIEKLARRIVRAQERQRARGIRRRG
jgi:hypothetical protein